MDKKYDIVPAFFWMGLSLFVMVLAYYLNLGSFRNPGPGLAPFLAGIALFLLSLFMVARSLRNKESRNDVKKEASPNEGYVMKIGITTGSILAYALVLEHLGYLISTPLLLILLFKIAGLQQWKAVLFASALATSGSYFLFIYLGVSFPTGIIGG